MNMFFLILFLLYFIFSAIVFFTTFKKDGTLIQEEFPFISVIVVVRNEEKNIRDCLISLKNQIFPENKFEVIVVDDHSTDKTPKIIHEKIKSLDHFYYTKLPDNIFRKRNALIHGIKMAKGEYIFHLDGDCTANEFWLAELCAHMEEGKAIVGGHTLIHYKKKFFEKLQALEYLYLHSICKTLSSRTKACSLFGNNMAFKKEAYDKTGGYESIQNEILEDYQLVRIIQKEEANKGRLICNKNSLVRTKPMNGYKDYFYQRRLWVSGILEVKIVGKAIFFVSVIIYTILTIYPFFSKYYYVLIPMRLAADFLIVSNLIRIFRLFNLIPFFVFFHVNSILTTIMTGLSLALYPKTKWKGRTVQSSHTL